MVCDIWDILIEKIWIKYINLSCLWEHQSEELKEKRGGHQVLKVVQNAYFNGTVETTLIKMRWGLTLHSGSIFLRHDRKEGGGRRKEKKIKKISAEP